MDTHAQNGLEQTVQKHDLSSLSDAKLTQKTKESMQKAGITRKKPDLALYQLQKKQEKNASYADESWLSRVKRTLVDVFSDSEKQAYTKQLSEVKKTHTLYEKKVSYLNDVLEEQADKLSSVGLRLIDAREAASLSLEQYTRATHRLEKVSSQLEQLTSSTNSAYSSSTREKRAQKRELQKHQRETYRETSRAMSTYRSLLKHEQALTRRYDVLNEHVGVLQEQSDHVELLLQDFELEENLRFSSDGRTLEHLYEQVGIEVQKMQQLSTGVDAVYSGPELDDTFSVDMNPLQESDELIQQWMRTPAP